MAGRPHTGMGSVVALARRDPARHGDLRLRALTSVVAARRSWAAAAVPLAMTGSNVLAYALVLLAAHRLDAGQFGEVSSLLGLLLISTIPMTALQTVAARRAARG